MSAPFHFNPTCLRLGEAAADHYDLEDYQAATPRWCAGCGDNAVLAGIQRLCREEQLPPERVVFVSGIGCSSRFPHYMRTYGFHGIHGRALPIAEGVAIRRPDLHVFVNMGDGDCCSIGAAHWIHAIRYNMNMTVVLHDNHIFGLTKMQASPTSPQGLVTRTTPRGAWLEPIDPLSTTLGVANVSFVAQSVDWIPELFHEIFARAFHHRGLSFVRVLQRCPEFLPLLFDPWLHDPESILLLTHADGIQPGPGLSQTCPRQQVHDPGDLGRAREIAALRDRIPVGILYRDESVPCYEDLRRPQGVRTPERIRRGVEGEFDRFTVWPAGAERSP